MICAKCNLNLGKETFASILILLLILCMSLAFEFLQVVVFIDICLEKAFEYNDYRRSHQPPIIFIKSEVWGLFGSVFCDFSPEFPVFHDEDPHTGIVTQVRQPNVNFKPLREALKGPWWFISTWLLQVWSSTHPTPGISSAR